MSSYFTMAGTMALTETFFSRYRNIRVVWGHDGLPSEYTIFLRQATQILFSDLLPHLTDREAFWNGLHDQLARELGIFVLSDGPKYQDRCARFLAQPYDLWRNDHRDPEYFFKTRMSLIELALRQYEEIVAASSKLDRITGGLFSWMRAGTVADTGPTAIAEAVRAGINELNARLRHARLGFAYHAGHIQIEDDKVTAGLIDEPFWELIRDQRWKNVQVDIKEAIDRHDTGGRDPALYALKALESVIKIISDERGYTRGTERGPAHFVDNLVSAVNGRFIEPWESDLLKALFRDVRNPHSHGPGSGELRELTHQQESWVVESVMSWVKSLIRRM